MPFLLLILWITATSAQWVFVFRGKGEWTSDSGATVVLFCRGAHVDHLRRLLLRIDVLLAYRSVQRGKLDGNGTVVVLGQSFSTWKRVEECGFDPPCLRVRRIGYASNGTKYLSATCPRKFEFAGAFASWDLLETENPWEGAAMSDSMTCPVCAASFRLAQRMRKARRSSAPSAANRWSSPAPAWPNAARESRSSPTQAGKPRPVLALAGGAGAGGAAARRPGLGSSIRGEPDTQKQFSEKDGEQSPGETGSSRANRRSVRRSARDPHAVLATSAR